MLPHLRPIPRPISWKFHSMRRIPSRQLSAMPRSFSFCGLGIYLMRHRRKIPHRINLVESTGFHRLFSLSFHAALLLFRRRSIRRAPPRISRTATPRPIPSSKPRFLFSFFFFFFAADAESAPSVDVLEVAKLNAVGVDEGSTENVSERSSRDIKDRTKKITRLKFPRRKVIRLNGANHKRFFVICINGPDFPRVRSIRLPG